MTTTVPLRRVHAARVTASPRPQPGNVVSARRTPAPANRPTPTVRAGLLVQAAVDAGLVQDTKESRREFAAWCARDSAAAVGALVGYRKIKAADAPLPAGREATARPAPAAPSAEPLYPASWALPASQASPSSYRTAKSQNRPSPVRAAQTILAPGDTRAYLAAQAAVADTNRLAAQRRLHAHSDPHSLVAAASGPARAQQAAERAELDRRAAAHAARYGR